MNHYNCQTKEFIVDNKIVMVEEKIIVSIKETTNTHKKTTEEIGATNN